MNSSSSDEEKCRYFERILMKKDIGKKSAGLFLKWAELEDHVHGREQAIIVLEKGIELGAEPSELLRNRKITLVDRGSDNSVVKSDGDDAATVKIPTVDLKIAAKIKRKSVSFLSAPLSKLHKVSGNHVSGEESENIVNTRDPGNLSCPASFPAGNSNKASSGILSSNLLCKSEYLSLNGDSFAVLQLIGKGGSSTVHKVISFNDGALYALKRIDVKDTEDADEILEGYANEVSLLNSLNGSQHIVELISYNINKEDRKLTLLLECGDIDLAKMLNLRMREAKASSGGNSCFIDPLFARLIWKDMLLAVQHIHKNRIVHGDLKPANFVFVKGHLKLIDFGIAKSISADTTNIYRDSQIGTINYMAPEAICPVTTEENSGGSKTMKLGTASDIWSLGCILYQMLYCRPPFASLTTVQKLSAIPNPNYIISYPEHADLDGVHTVQACLVRDHKSRIRIEGEEGLLNMKYLNPYRSIRDVDIPTASLPSSHQQLPRLSPEHMIKKVLEVLKDSARTSHPHASKFIDKWFSEIDTSSMLRRLQTSESSPEHKVDDKKIKDDDSECPSSSNSQLESIDSNDDTKVKSECFANRRPYSLRAFARVNNDSEDNKSYNSESNRNSRNKALPVEIRSEIRNICSKDALVPITSQKAYERASRWMKPVIKIDESEALDMGVLLKKTMGEMRRFMDLDQDNITHTDSFDITGLNF